MAAYIKFDGVEGACEEENHKGWSDMVSSYCRGIFLNDLVCSKEFDKASPKIIEAVYKGKVYPKVYINITAPDVGRVAYYRYELTNVLVTNYSIGGLGQAVPWEILDLNFKEMKSGVVSLSANMHLEWV